MLLSIAQKEALRALAMVTLVFGTAGAAVVASVHPMAAPPASPSTLTPPVDWSGARISLTSLADVEPPTGCIALTYPADEAALREYLGPLNGGYYPWYFAEGDMRGGPVSATAGGAVPPAAPEHSGTNNQVAGVDEADLVKTDGWYIYTATGGHIVIVKAYPASEMEVASTIELGGYANGIFVVGDRLVVILQPMYAYGGGPGPVPLGSFAPTFYTSNVELRVYDIADRSSPSILFNYSVEGTFSGARMIGDFVYLVTDHYIYEVDGVLHLPAISDNGKVAQISPSAVGVPPGTLNTTFLTTILSMNVSAASSVKSFSFLTEGSGQIYVSAHNLYILGASYTYSANYTLLETQTIIAKFSFYKGDVTCYFGARVKGTVINQFSADESSYGGHPYLRLATTVRAGAWGNTSASITVLDERLAVVGSIDGIAPGETVQTSRFLGARGYLVTFRQVDPLFVLDLSNPSAPKILAELTLPGFSQYLEPIGESHLVGIGVDAGRGLKLSLFDVSDSAHPREVANYSFGMYAYSEAQYDHHAVLYMASRGLLVIPVQTYDYTVDRMGSGTTWQGAYVFKVDLDTGFTVEARIAHDPVASGQSFDGTVYTYTPVVRRSLYIGESLYTVSDVTIKANSLADYSEEGSVSLGTPWTGYCCYAMDGVGTVGAPPPSSGSAGGI